MEGIKIYFKFNENDKEAVEIWVNGKLFGIVHPDLFFDSSEISSYLEQEGEVSCILKFLDGPYLKQSQYNERSLKSISGLTKEI